MKKQRAIQVVIGVLVLIFPFVGVPLPFAWEASILYVLGIAVIALAFPIGDMARRFFRRSCCGGEGCDVCEPRRADLADDQSPGVEPATY